MDIVLVCAVGDFYATLNGIFLTSIVSSLNEKFDINITIDYQHSRMLINIKCDKGDPIYIKRCDTSDLIQELKKIESIYS